MLLPRELNVTDTSSETTDMKSKRMLSLRLLYFTIFLGNVGFSIVMSSVWPFLNILISTATTGFLGIVIAGFCVGQFVTSPFFGILENKTNGSKIPILVGLTFQLIGNLMWSYLQDLPRWNGYTMLIARIVTGIGSGSMATIRSYVSRATTLEERTGVNAIISACMALGFCVGPGIQAGMVYIGYPGPVEVSGFHLNLYTSPSWLGAILTAANLIVILIFFQEFRIADDPITEAQINADIIYNASSDTEPDEKESLGEQAHFRPDYVVVVVLLACFFILFFLFTMVETMTTPLAQYEFAWSKKQATEYIGYMWLSSGILSIFVVMFMRIPCIARLSERFTLLISVGCLVLSVVLYIPFAGPHPEILWLNGTSNSTAGINERGGCPSTLHWCFNEPRLFLSQMLIATVFLTIGFASVNLLVATTYSKVLGPIPQGLWMGFYMASGSLARIIGSIYLGFSLQHFGPRITLITISCVTSLMWFALVGCYKRLIPYAVRLERTLRERLENERSCTDDEILNQGVIS